MICPMDHQSATLSLIATQNNNQPQSENFKFMDSLKELKFKKLLDTKITLSNI